MENVLRSELLGDYRSDKMGEEDTLLNGKPALAMSKLASIEEASDMLTERKGGEMLVMGKIPPSCRPRATDNNKVSGSQKIRDDLRSLVRNYLDGRLKLLEMDYQPNE